MRISYTYVIFILVKMILENFQKNVLYEKVQFRIFGMFKDVSEYIVIYKIVTYSYRILFRIVSYLWIHLVCKIQVPPAIPSH